MPSFINRLFSKSHPPDQASTGGRCISDKASKNAYRVDVSSKEKRERAKASASAENESLQRRRQEERQKVEALKNGTNDCSIKDQDQYQTTSGTERHPPHSTEPFYQGSAVEPGADPSSTHWSGRTKDTRSSESPYPYGAFYGPSAVEDGANPKSTHWSGH